MSTTEMRSKDHDDEGIEIRLSEVTKFLKDNRWRILLGAVAGLLIGALYAFSKPNVYVSQVTVMPEIQAKGASGFGNLGSLASLAGINIDNVSGQDAIRPDLYPNILQSVPFSLYLLNQPVYSQKLQANMTLQEFINRINSDNFVSKITGMFAVSNEQNKDEKLDPKNFSQAVQITKDQEQLIKIIQSNATSAYDKKTGILTISVADQDPVVSATVARLSLEYLTNYITAYRTEKARKQVVFLEQRVRDVKKRYQSSEYALSDYRDRNRSLFTNTAKIDEQRLQADYLLEQSVYNELSKQLEQAKIKVQDETPVFKILGPPTVPLHKSGPKRVVIILGFIVFGVIVTLSIAIVKRIQSRI